MLLFDVFIGHGDPVRHCGLEALEHERPAYVFFELTGGDRRLLTSEDLEIGRFPDELSVLLEWRHRDDAFPYFRIGNGHADALGFL